MECSRSNVVSFPLGVRIYCFCCLFGELLCVSTVARGLGCKKRESHFLLDFSEEANIFWPKIRKDNKSPLACGKHSSRPGSKRWKHSPVIQDCVVNFTKKVFFFHFLMISHVSVTPKYNKLDFFCEIIKTILDLELEVRQVTPNNNIMNETPSCMILWLCATVIIMNCLNLLTFFTRALFLKITFVRVQEMSRQLSRMFFVRPSPPSGKLVVVYWQASQQAGLGSNQGWLWLLLFNISVTIGWLLW